MRSIIAEILSKLEPYLDKLDREWELLPLDDKRPTLPNHRGQVNVRAITGAIGLRQSQEQHFYRKQELATPINIIAKIQGLRGINSRDLENASDRVQAERLDKLARHNSNLSRSGAEREALIVRLRHEVEALREQLAMLENTGMAIRTSMVE